MMSPTRQSDASDSFNEIATIRIELRHTNPLIWRQVEVPTSITLKVLHDIIQAVMGWFDYHLWEFAIGKQRYGVPMDDHWGAEPPLVAAKVRLRDVLKPGRCSGPARSPPPGRGSSRRGADRAALLAR